MNEAKSRPVSEVVSWVLLGLTFPLSGLILKPLREETLKSFEELIGDKPLPVVTALFATWPGNLWLMGGVLGSVIVILGIYSVKVPIFKRHKVGVISLAWLFSFLLFFVLILSLFLPYLTVTYGIWWEIEEVNGVTRRP